MLTPDKVLLKFAGGQDFVNFVEVPDVARAFKEVVTNARYEHGHGGYSGTIAEKGSYRIRQDAPMGRVEAYRFVDKDINNNDKWGPAFAVPVGETKPGTTKKVTIKVQASHRHYVIEKATDALMEKFKAPGKSVSVKIGAFQVLKAGKLPEILATKGTQDGYRVRSNTLHEYSLKPMYASRAEAIAALKEYLLREKPTKGAQYTIEKFKVLDVLTIGDTSKTEDTYEVEAEVTVSSTSSKIIGWIFYGVASS